MPNVNFNSGFNGFQNLPQPNQGPATGGYSVAAVPVAAVPVAVAVPVYPVALTPSYIGAQGPAAYSGAAGSSAASASGHVTANPTNAVASSGNGAGGFGASGAVGGYAGGYGFGLPVAFSPVLLGIGFPVYYGGSAPTQPGPVADPAPTPTPQPAPEPPVADVPDVPDAPTPTPPPVIDVVPPAADLPTLPIAEVSAEDFARYRYAESSKKAESSLQLSLTTQDGDVISLDFSQIDIQESSRFRGKTLEGDRVRDFSFLEDTQRVVNLSVEGSLSTEEQAAIDEVLATAIDVVQKFFSGDLSGAVDKLKALNFDTSELAELSLDLSMTRTAEVTRGYLGGPERNYDTLTKDADIVQALEFLASEQRRMIDVANSAFDTPSSVKLVKSLLPPLLSEPFADLQSEIDAAKETVAVPDVSQTTDDAIDGAIVEKVIDDIADSVVDTKAALAAGIEQVVTYPPADQPTQ